MAKYRKRPVVIDAWRWQQPGDAPDSPTILDKMIVIPYMLNPQRGDTADKPCAGCRGTLGAHGMIQTLEGWHIVCPGDYVIKGTKGEFYPCKPDIFESTYDLAEEQ